MPNPFEGVRIDRIGTDVIVGFPDEQTAEECRATIEHLLPMMATLVALFENGGWDGSFGP
jgi:tRNA A37 methylthiotransferase MiaB